MKGAHGLQPDHHEHVHCHHCNANAVHVEQPSPGRPDLDGQVLYGPHAMKGGTFPCMASRGQIVPAEHRHQGDPL